ncbi:MAG: hypothetical protein ACOX1A_02115 [Saccharofermentanales bacterium]
MSKSYENTISFADSPEEVKSKVMNMITDPAPHSQNRPRPSGNMHGLRFPPCFQIKKSGKISVMSCRKGEIGCVQCKRKLQEKLLAFHQPIHEKRTRLLQSPDHLRELIEDGSARARVQAQKALSQARTAMNIAP